MERFDYYDCRYYPEDVVRDCIASYYAFVSYVDDCVGKKYKFIYTLDDINELYDIENDPMEMHNLCMYSLYAKIAKDMEEKVLEDWDMPILPIYALWNDLRERKQKQLLAGAPVKNYRPAPPNFVMQHASKELGKTIRRND